MMKTDLGGSCYFVSGVGHHTEHAESEDTQLTATDDRL